MPTIAISDKLYEALKREATARGKTVDQLVEEIIAEWLGAGLTPEEEREVARRLRELGYA
ncbi:MAG: ribbon-helix-helix protein, CopG family [Pyrobaculum sp.]